MTNDIELKTVVSQQVHDDFLVAARTHGFNNKSECLRYLVEHFLYGCIPQFQNNTKGIDKEWRNQGE